MGFSSRALAEAADLKTSVGFIFAEEGQEDFAEMSMNAKVETTDAEVDSLTIKAIFAAKEGKGADLVKQFEAVVGGIKEYAMAMEGPHAGAMVDAILGVEAGEDDEAVIKIVPPPKEEKEEEKKMEDAFEGLKPKFSASFTTGRSIEQMYKNADSNIAMLPHGVSGHVDATLSKALFEQLKKPDPFIPPNIAESAKMLSAMALADMKYEFRYRGDDAAKAFDGLPNIKEAVEVFSKNFASAPESILEPIHGLADLSDGVKSVEISGLPHKYGILVTFKNFHITPILKDMIGDIDAEKAEEEVLRKL